MPVNRAAVIRTVLALLLYAALTLPFASQYLWHFDSGNYAFALREYNVLFDRPQPPGFPLFIMIVKPLYLLLGDANLALVLVNWLAGAGALAAFFVMLRRHASPLPLSWALWLATLPLFWHYTIISWMHAVTACLYALLLLLLDRLQMTGRGLVFSAVAIAAAAGFRQEAPLFLVLPFLLAARRAGLLRFAPLLRAALAFLFALALWAAPFVAMHLPDYFIMQADYAAIVAGKTSVFAGGFASILTNLRNLGAPLLRGATTMLPLLAAVAAVLFVRPALRRDPLLTLAATFLATPLLFYVLIHIGSSGYLLTLLVPLAVLIARAASGISPTAVRLMLAAAIMANLVYIFGASDRFTRREIVRHDRYFARLLPAIRAQFPPAHTVIIDADNYRQLANYLPDYPVIWPLPLIKIGAGRYYDHYVVARDYRENHRGRFFFDNYADTQYLVPAGTLVVVTDEGLWPRCAPPIDLTVAGEFAWWRAPQSGTLVFERSGISFRPDQPADMPAGASAATGASR